MLASSRDGSLLDLEEGSIHRPRWWETPSVTPSGGSVHRGMCCCFEDDIFDPRRDPAPSPSSSSVRCHAGLVG